ncbi:hypothetical protein [Streptomyces blattellae]|uniref:hypothetical protein n=1 Tax=Streptomyces blattellae TaxID=2569855 RepID=UPI0012B8679F|nr:hypothetical protein [Streptomyces blattellae]
MGAAADPPAARERDRRLREELTAGPVELIRLTERRGAFRRFKDVLARDECAWRRFHRLSGERRLGPARAWLAEEGCRPRLPVGGDG